MMDCTKGAEVIGRTYRARVKWGNDVFGLHEVELEGPKAWVEEMLIVYGANTHHPIAEERAQKKLKITQEGVRQ